MVALSAVAKLSPAREQTVELLVQGAHCANCIRKIETGVPKLSGVRDARFNLSTGKLTVRTTPYSEVFENGKKLGETPFADREITAGVHTLVFKNPLHPTVSKKITITAGKLLKLGFSLPD